jgi:chitin synthase
VIGFATVVAIACSIFILVLEIDHNLHGKDNLGVLLFILAFFGAFGSFILCALFHNQALVVSRGMIYYILLLPSYTNLFLIYAFCNIHDVTWGNRAGGSYNHNEHLGTEAI